MVRGIAGRILVRRSRKTPLNSVHQTGWGFSFDYQPGQYIDRLLVDGRWRWRSAPLTPSPAAPVRAQIAQKAMPRGFLSTCGRGKARDQGGWLRPGGYHTGSGALILF